MTPYGMIRDMNRGRDRPPSATHGAVAATGLAAFLAATIAVRLYRPFGQAVVPSGVAIIAVTTAAIFLVDIAWQKVHRRPSTGLDFTYDDPSWPRTLIKVVGLLASVGFVGLGYWLFPDYHRAFFDDYFQLLRIVAIPWIVLAVPYFFWVDRRMRDPRDGYWHLGNTVLFRWRQVERNAVVQHLLGWIIKGYFAALMFSYTCTDVKNLFLFDFGTLVTSTALYAFLSHFLYFIDTAIAAMGYIMSFRVTDTHIRSAEPTMLGWVVAIICYEPFYSFLVRLYLPYATGYRLGSLARFPAGSLHHLGECAPRTRRRLRLVDRDVRREVLQPDPSRHHHRWTLRLDEAPGVPDEEHLFLDDGCPIHAERHAGRNDRPMPVADRREPYLCHACEDRRMAPVARPRVCAIRALDRGARPAALAEAPAAASAAGIPRTCAKLPVGEPQSGALEAKRGAKRPPVHGRGLRRITS